MVRDYDAFTRFVAGRAAMPFEWGSAANDCISFAVGCSLVQGCPNPLGDLAWADEDEAYRVIESVGGLVEAISARLRPIAPALAHRGDWAGVMRGNEIGIMVVEGKLLVGPGVARQIRRPRRDMVLAWSAG